MNISSSLNACTIHLEGGPFDGTSHLHDCAAYDSIVMSDKESKKFAMYVPKAGKIFGKPREKVVYVFDKLSGKC